MHNPIEGDIVITLINNSVIYFKTIWFYWIKYQRPIEWDVRIYWGHINIDVWEVIAVGVVKGELQKVLLKAFQQVRERERMWVETSADTMIKESYKAGRSFQWRHGWASEERGGGGGMGSGWNYFLKIFINILRHLYQNRYDS